MVIENPGEPIPRLNRKAAVELQRASGEKEISGKFPAFHALESTMYRRRADLIPKMPRTIEVRGGDMAISFQDIQGVPRFSTTFENAITLLFEELVRRF
jgi:hypothetical protein